ncbi:TetR/AcrR family transcriptional regulator [Streptomyces sp. N2-109]|uniref:TetR/AcrR family transcriptional regulator n=1 Tax=Streptomyces gossypii TaxID=2883101 RepID=A0ABT2JYI5_9ACTN|nr:TetR/AcrR family transcriptional regulator [Streptomyces gossypii]MCT2592743.1 TetR/AcrR family transcriptional regulator [Streptomyces gossypii]
MSPTSAERGQESRARLLGAAAQLIVEGGWGSVTTRKAADRAGVPPGLVHYHFRTVDDLLIDAALEGARREAEAVAATLARTEDPAAGIAQVLEQLAAYTSEDAATILFSEMLLAATRHERLREGLSELMGEWRAAMTAWLRESGGPADAEGTVLLLGAALDGLVLHRLVDPGLRQVSVLGPLRRMVGLGEG